MKRLLLALLFAGLATAATAHSFKSDGIMIGHPWTPPLAKAEDGAAVYLALMNQGEKADQLTGASTSIARKVVLRERNPDGNGTTVVNAIDLPLKRGVALRPGASHIRLENLRGPLAKGDKFTLRLTFAEAPAVDVVVFVEDHGTQHE